MTGIIKTVQSQKGYGFIICERKEYFFHKDDFLGSWPELTELFERHIRIEVAFEEVQSRKGLRAANVTFNQVG